MLDDGAPRGASPPDHVIESFRNDLWPGYKTSAGVDADLLAQFEPLEDALRALGVTVWATVDVEADDALAAAATVAEADPRVEQVVICTPDKDLAQAVVGERVVQLDRRNGTVRARPGWWRASACPRRRSPTGWPWSAQRDGFPAPGLGGEVGGGCSPATASRSDPATPPTGRYPCAAPRTRGHPGRASRRR